MEEFLADAVAFAVDLFWGGAEGFEEAFGHGECDFAFAREYVVCALCEEGLGLLEVVGASDDADGGVEFFDFAEGGGGLVV